MRLFAALLLSAAIASPAAAQQACKGADCDRQSPWRSLTQVSMIVSDPDSPGLEIYRAEFDPVRRDVGINVDLRRADGEVRGIVAMVAGRVMITKGIAVEPGRETEVLDLPLAHIQLMQILLGRALPSGPDALRGERRIEHRDKTPIRYGTAGAQGRIEGPWRVQGRATRVQTGAIHYDLLLEAPVADAAARKKGEKLRMQMQGELSVLGRAVFPEDAKLEGWNAYVLGPRAEKRGDRTVMSFGATPEPAGRFATIEDVRAYVAKREKDAAATK
jgi:hypothetical protein